jgi:AcrR family transcriptional regulator
MSAAPVRRRLNPAVRRDLILDEAARVVLADGLSAVSMEAIGRAAGVSKALVYTYFPSKAALLAELLVREYRAFQVGARAAAAGADGFESLVRLTTRAWLDHVVARGALIQRLLAEPAAAQALQAAEGEGREATVAFFGHEIARAFAIPRPTAMTVADLLMGMTGAAGDHLARTGGDPAAVEAMVVEMIMAALQQVARDRTLARPGTVDTLRLDR